MNKFEQLQFHFSTVNFDRLTVKDKSYVKSIIEADNLDNAAKVRFLARKFLCESDSLIVVDILNLFTNSELESVISVLDNNINPDDTYNSAVDDQTISGVDDSEMDLLEDMGSRVFDPSRVIESGKTKNLPATTIEKFELDGIEYGEILIIKMLLDIDRVEAKKYITSRIQDINTFEDSEVIAIVDDLIKEHIINNDERFYAIYTDENGSKNITLLEYFKMDGYSEHDSIVKSIEYVRNYILNKEDSESSSVEYCLSEYNWDDRSKNTDEVIFDGVTIVPARKVVYDYAVNINNDGPLRLTKSNKRVPHREFAPYDIDRCGFLLDSIKSYWNACTTIDNNEQLRLDMETAFAEFKYAEASCIAKYADINLSFNEWTNDILSESYCNKQMKSYKDKDVKLSTIEVLNKGMVSKFDFIETSDEYKHAYNDIRSVYIAYYIFKNKECVYNDIISALESE